MKYSVGDRVKCIIPQDGFGAVTLFEATKDANGGSGWKEGRQFIVMEITKVGDRQVLWEDTPGHTVGGVFNDWVELVDPSYNTVIDLIKKEIGI